MGSAETLLVIFVGVTAVSLILQAFAVRRTVRSADALMAKLSKTSNNLEKDAREIVDQLKEVAAGLDHLRTIFGHLGDRAVEVSEMAQTRVHDIEQLVDKIVEVGTRQAGKVDAVVTDTVEKFEQTTEILQQDILKPIVEISSVIRGLKTGLEFLFARKTSTGREKDYPEDELFI